MKNSEIRTTHRFRLTRNLACIEFFLLFYIGLDLDCGIGNLNYYMNYTESAVKLGKMRESDIDNALKNLYTLLMRVGFFDNIPAYESLGVNDICTKDNIELAADAARQALVLLKNEDNTLPLDSKKFKNIALIGPHANSTKAMIGNYEGISSSK